MSTHGSKRLRVWLSRQANGSYLLTTELPVVERVGYKGELDLYVAPGDAMGFRHVCPWFVGKLWGVELKPLESIRVVFYGELANDQTS